MLRIIGRTMLTILPVLPMSALMLPVLQRSERYLMSVEFDARALSACRVGKMSGRRRQERAVLLIELIVREIEAPGDMAGAEPRARLGLGAGEAAA